MIDVSDPARRRRGDSPTHQDMTGRGPYGGDPAREVVEPPTDPVRQAIETDVDDPADAMADPAVLRDGGPTRTRGVMTTTGGRAGPASSRRRGRRGRGVAPTTTGDATSGGKGTPAGGPTSDSTTGGATIGRFTDR